MKHVVRLSRIAVFALATLAATSANAAVVSAEKGCWAAECGADPIPWKLVLPICYAHEGSQFVPQCTGD